MRTSKIPPIEDLEPYVDNKKEAAEKYGVTTKTIIRWLKQYNLVTEVLCSSHKLNLDKAIEIRRLHKEGESMKDLAAKYGVTFSAISRIIHNIVYRQEKDIADVKVIYNPDPGSASVIAIFN
jgi:lambda repressor-like predicted transcriptional regulator